ncbi:MAG TPA: type 1 glutamine amidotransferase domain-containing protein [Mycobacteriales bacterium]
MGSTLRGKNIAFLVANEGVERVELTEPWNAVEDEGGAPRLVAPHAGIVQTFDHLDKSAAFEVDAAVADVDPDEFDGLVLPGGVANPDRLRTSQPAVEFVRRLFELGRPVAVICHGSWTLVEADQVRGRRITSWPSLKTDIRNAGGEWVDEEVVVDTNGPNVLISSRRPDDLKAFCGEIVERF